MTEERMRTATFWLNLFVMVLVILIAVGNWRASSERARLFERVAALEKALDKPQHMPLQQQPEKPKKEE